MTPLAALFLFTLGAVLAAGFLAAAILAHTVPNNRHRSPKP